jgi:DNA invertase Pin-like site-specific DNA recombinase
MPSGEPNPSLEAVMSTQRHLAVSYSRFSDPKQGKGDSEDRQERDYRQFCRRHNLTPLAEVFVDRGRSGYKDEHRKKGRFGQLVAMAKDGRFEPGTVIVVEAWDRLGRLRPDKQTDLIAELLRTGVSIGICRLDDIFTEEDFGTHKWTTLAVFVQLAYQESKQKAERVAASWDRRRARAREGGALLTGRVPAWLKVFNGKAVPIPERVAVLKRIFHLAADGYGRARIIRTLKAEGVAPFGDSGKWTAPYVAKILNNRTALGELQPRKDDGTPEGPVITDYYPRVISEQEYLLARAGQDRRRGRGGRRDRRYVNVFQSILFHARDGEGFVLGNRGTEKNPQLILVNAAGMAGRARTCTFPYHVFEEQVLGRLKEVGPHDVFPRRGEAPSRANVLRAKLANVRHDLAQLQADLKEGYSKALAAVLREKEAEEEKAGQELQEELARSVRPAEKAWQQLPSLVDMLRKGGDEARLKLRPVLRSAVEAIRVLIVRNRGYQLAVVEVCFTGGNVRSYVIYYRPARFQKPAASHAVSWTATTPDGKPTRFGPDLSDPAGVRDAEILLLAMSPEQIEESLSYYKPI